MPSALLDCRPILPMTTLRLACQTRNRNGLAELQTSQEGYSLPPSTAAGYFVRATDTIKARGGDVMQSLFNRVGKAVIPASVLLTCQQLLANSGIQLPLSQFQAGTEHANLVNNGAFTQHGPLDANGLTHQADNWDQFGGIYVTNQPFNPPPNVAALGGAVAIAKTGEDTPDQYSQPVNPTALNPGANYVLSAYIWNRGRPDQGLTSGDLAIVKIVDTTNAIDHNLSLVLDPAAADGGSGGNGYFIYD